MVNELLLPDNYRLVPTDEPVPNFSWGRRFFLRSSAEEFAELHSPSALPTYRNEVVRRGFFKYEVVAFQNRIVKVGDDSRSS